MKIVTKLVFLILLSGFFYSCETVTEQKASKQLSRADSIAQATLQAQALNQTLQTQLAEMTAQYARLKTELDSARGNIRSLNECQFWMTKEECDKQAHDLTIKIKSLEKEVADVGQRSVETSIKLKQVEEQLASK